MQHLVRALLAFSFVFAAAHARADTYIVQGGGSTPYAAPPPAYAPYGPRRSVFQSAFQGLFAGGVAGLGTGYLIVRPSGLEGEEWRALVFGAGVGALTGAGLGLTMGILDRSDSWNGYYVARDLSYGVGLGVVAGAIGGGLSAVLTREPEHILAGTAIGAVAGFGLGLITGILEEQFREHRHAASSRARRLSWNMGQGPTPRSWVAGVSGRF